MARYGIERLNYITSGENRTFVNMDVRLDGLDVFDYVHLLAVEDVPEKDDPLRFDVLLEQRQGRFLNTRYLQAESTAERPVDELHSDKYFDSLSDMVSVFLSALANEGFDESIVLNEQQQYYREDAPGGGIYARLYLSCCSEEYRRQLIDFFNANEKLGHTYVIEHNQRDAGKNVVSKFRGGETGALYDIDDVCLKSMNRVSNQVLPDFDQASPGKSEDFYVPSGTGVKGFCQVDNNTYVLTDTTASSPDSVRAQLAVGEEIDAKTSQYAVQIEPGGALGARLYRPVSDLSGAGSYAEAISAGTMTVDGFYGVYGDMDEVEYNYIVGVPMKKISERDGRTDYDNGNVYGDIVHAKNMYNSVYSMQMSSDSSLLWCRDYTSVGTCGGKLYLKFDDNVNYFGGGERKQVSGEYSYPKIEYMNKIVTKTTNRHKSYFFSVNVMDLNLDYDEKDADRQSSASRLKKYIKHDIKTAIGEIVKNVCPAQTQLFDVFFDDSP